MPITHPVSSETGCSSGMAFALKNIEAVELRAAGLVEKWLQTQILNDTSILGLGELEVSRESAVSRMAARATS